MKNFFIFVHVPRTGGSTFSTILRKNFGDRMESVGNFDPRLENTGIDCISGHVLMHEEKMKGIGQWCEKYERNPVVLSFVRNPLDRIVSWYIYRTKMQRKPVHFNEWLKNNYIANEQSLYLCGGPAMSMTLGVTEMFDESLQMFQMVFPDELKDIDYGGKKHNQSDPVRLKAFGEDRTINTIDVRVQDEVDYALYIQSIFIVRDFVRANEPRKED